MKKIKLLAVLLCVCPMMMFGQLEVRPDGTVRVNVSGSPNPTLGFSSSITTTPRLAPSISAGVSGHSAIVGGTASSGASIGVYGVGSGCQQRGRNIGVFGRLGMSYPSSPGPPPTVQNGAAIFGSILSTGHTRSFSQPFAGFFIGDTHVEGLLSATSTSWNSDYRFKENITDLNSVNAFNSTDLNSRNVINNVLRLNPVVYNLRQRYIEFQDSTGTTVREAVFSENSQLLQRRHFGLIAQEVQQLYPDLVFENGDGYLGINYIGIIPLLIQALKEQNVTIQGLRAEVDDLRRSNPPIIGVRPMQHNADIFALETVLFDDEDIFALQNERSAALFQNAPNPFSQSTEIRYYLPTSVSNAFLGIYDLNGRQLRQIRLTERGEGIQMISGAELPAGIYLYALIADGQKIDVKRMILTE